MSELTNLLPPDRIRAFRRDYFFRLATLCALSVSFLIVVHGALLTPSYLYLSEEVKTRQEHLAGLEAALSQSPEQSVRARLQKTASNATELLTLTKRPSASAVIREVLLVPSQGITIRGFTVTPSSSADGEMRITGVGATREALRQYHERLSALSFVQKAELPLSVYARESDIQFSITLTGTLMP